jgi:hypothetical protein
MGLAMKVLLGPPRRRRDPSRKQADPYRNQADASPRRMVPSQQRLSAKEVTLAEVQAAILERYNVVESIHITLRAVKPPGTSGA